MVWRGTKKEIGRPLEPVTRNRVKWMSQGILTTLPKLNSALVEYGGVAWWLGLNDVMVKRLEFNCQLISIQVPPLPICVFGPIP